MSIARSPVESAEDWDRVRDEWLADLDALYSEVEAWAEAQGWATRRYPDLSIEEDGLGRYPASRLLVHAPQGRVVFEPVARRVMGDATGLIDLCAMPSMSATKMMTRGEDGRWSIHPFGDSYVATPWSEANFLATARALFGSAD